MGKKKFDWREYRGDVVWIRGGVFKGGKITIKPQRHGEDPFIYGVITMESPFCVDCMEPRKELKYRGEFLPRIEGERGIILVKNRLLGGEINYEVIHINDAFAKSDWYEWITEDEEIYYITERKAKYLVSEEEIRELYHELRSEIEVNGGTLRLAGECYTNKEYDGEIVWRWGDAVMERGEHEERELRGDKLRLVLDTPRGKYILGLAILYKDGKEVASAFGEVFWYVRNGKGMAVLINFDNKDWKDRLMATIFINMDYDDTWEIPKMEGGAIIYGGVV